MGADYTGEYGDPSECTTECGNNGFRGASGELYVDITFPNDNFGTSGWTFSGEGGLVLFDSLYPGDGCYTKNGNVLTVICYVNADHGSYNFTLTHQNGFQLSDTVTF